MALRRRAPAIATATLLLVACASCGGSSGGSSADSTLAAEPLLVCSDIPYEPFEFERDGRLTGFDVDLVTALAERLGREATFVPTLLDQFPAALDAGTCELVASALLITDPASTTLVFSDPYLDVAQALLVRETDAGRLTSLASTSGATVGVVTDSPSADFAAGNLPPDAVVAPFTTIDDATAALAAGGIDAVLADSPLAEYAAREDDALAVTEQRTTTTRYGLATNAPRAELLGQVNEALAGLRSDGTYENLVTTWFGG